MKKLIFLTSLFVATLFGASTSFGQLYVGGRIGGTSASITGSGLKDFQPVSKMYLNGGLVTTVSLHPRFSLQMELLYSGKGSAFEYYGDYQNRRGVISLSQKLHYFAVPLVLQFKMGDRDNYFHFDAGMVYNSLIGNKFSGSITVEELNGDIFEYDMTTSFNLNKTDFGLAFGVGLVASNITFDFRYEIGQNQIYQTGSDDAPNILNRAFLVNVGYRFNLL
ncbi:MAG: PorT family protein [Bacteroidales bacterium]|nr:PorT family protein [Bacteroidales bacterium]